MAIDEQRLPRIGRYEIIREVGRGATAVVYLARQTDLDRNVALKELAAFHASDQAFIERFLRESRLAGSLNHPNIVTVHEYFEHDGTPFIAMEYLERGSLRPLLPTLSLPQVAGVLEGLLAGLAHAHAQGIVHRDLKPENVLVTSNGAVKIADFGIAKALEAGSSSPLTLTGATVGTPAYMAPEQALASHVGPPADLYAVGVLAYEMLSGEVPFHGSDVAMAIMLQHLNEPVPSLHAARPDLDADLCDWVERMLAKEPGNRPPAAADAWEELDEIVIRVLGPRWRRQSRLTESGAAAPRPPGWSATAATERLKPTRLLPTRLLSNHFVALSHKRRRIWAAALLSALALGLVAGGVAAAFALSGRDGLEKAATGRSTTSAGSTTLISEPRRVVPTLLTGLGLSTSGDPATATLRLRGTALAPGSIVVRDGDIGDGHAWFELRQAGIDARTRGRANNALSIRIRKAKNRLRVDLAAEKGAFARYQVRRVDRRTVLLTLTKPAPIVVHTSPSVTVTKPLGDTATTTTTTTTTPTESQPPPIKTR